MNLVRQAILSDAVVNRVAATNEMESLVREHARFVYKLAYSVLRNHHDAEDTAQETFVRVLRELELVSVPMPVVGKSISAD